MYKVYTYTDAIELRKHALRNKKTIYWKHPFRKERMGKS